MVFSFSLGSHFIISINLGVVNSFDTPITILPMIKVKIMPLLNDMFLVVGLLILFSASVISTETAPCIKNYHDLKTSIVNNSENAQNLLTTFYPPNRSPAHILIVYYYLASVYQEDNTDNITGNETHPHFENPNITADHIFQWMDSSTLLLTEFRLFKALTFGIAGLESGELEIKVDKPFCNSDDEVKLLNLATIWVSQCMNSRHL